MQLSFMDAVDAALTTGFPCGSWWWHAWQAGDAIPPGWRPPVPGADYPKPRLPAEASPGDACQSDEIDMEVAKAVDAWRPDGMANPFIGIHETRRLACGAAWARLEAWDAGLSHATVRDGVIEWGHVPGAGALVPQEGRWTRLPAEEEAQDAHWSEPGDAIPPGYTPPIAEEVLPGWDASHDGMRDRQIVSDVMEFLLSRFPPGIPFPWEGVVETHRYPDGAVWASLRAVHDGALSHLTLRDGVPVWSEAPGAGLLTYLRETSTWGRLPATETCDAEAPAAASALPDVVVPETEPSAPPDAEAIETSASAPSDVDPEPAEFPDVDPVYGTRRAPPPPPDFMEELVRKQAEARAQREEAWRPLKALVDAGLAKMGQHYEVRVRLLPPASDGLMLWYDPGFGHPKDVSLWITDPDIDPDILTRIEGILGVTARGAATSIRLLKAAPP